MTLFKTPTPEETRQYQAWAREHYTPFTPISGVWHPVVQAECVEINTEAGTEINDKFVWHTTDVDWI